ncbi:arginine--tRNA ligase [Ignavibacteria bacterium]|nr:arginine--tRNA ligase [Bacteroidota bacterium]
MIDEFILPAFEHIIRQKGWEGIATLFFEKPKIASHGELATAVAMSLAKPLRRAPRSIAEEIVAELKFPENIVESAEIAGAGFINLRLGTEFYLGTIRNMLRLLPGGYGRNQSGAGKRVNVEYVSANPTGLLHVGHGRNACIGDTVANLYEWSGYDVTREYYFNNAGNQMNMLAKSVYARYRQRCEPDFPMPEDGYQGDYIREIAAEAANKYGNSLNELTPENLEICRKEGEAWCFAAISRTLERLGVKHDTYFNEDSLYSNGKIKELLDELREKDLSYEKDGAVWLRFSRIDETLQDRVIVKSSGEPTYRLPDIAYHKNKLERSFDIIADIFGADHIAAIPDVIAAIKALGLDYQRIKPLIYQFVTLTQGGEQVKMSKRTGKSYTLDDLIEEFGADVTRFFFVMRGINTPLEFDIDLAKDQSDKNPVFYLQYAHARVCSLFAQAAQRNIASGVTAEMPMLHDVNHRELTQVLARFPQIVQKAAANSEPQLIADYLRETATEFHTFYHNCPCLRDDVPAELRTARLALSNITQEVLRNGLAILGISAPERM